jgi:AcrR family transcriptional regulator
MTVLEQQASRPAHAAQREINLSTVKARQKNPTKAEQRAETTEKILDEAEYLFSCHGLHGVTLKDVAKRVGVHHTLLNYYFEDKQKLFEAVFGRRAVVANEVRMKALDEYDR